MRIVSFRRDGKISYGLLEGDEIADLPELDPQLPPALNGALPTLRDYVPPAGTRKTVTRENWKNAARNGSDAVVPSSPPEHSPKNSAG